MRKFLPCFLMLGILILSSEIFAQTLNDGPINLRVRVRQVQVTNSPTDLAIVGPPDEYTMNFWARDQGNTSGLGWGGGSGCLQHDGNGPLITVDFNRNLFNHNFGVTVPRYFEIRQDSWEDDCDSDPLAQSGSRCAFNTNCCIGVNSPFGCIGSKTDDDDHCVGNPFKSNMDYRLGPPCEWYSHGFVSGSCAHNVYRPDIESYWRYTSGTSCSDPIALGTLNSGASLTHFNSNVCYTNNFSASPGNDVFYSFTITSAMGVEISLCNSTNFNTNLYLLNSSCNQLYFNNNGCGNQSIINENLCSPGTYIVVVDGNAAGDMGTFTLEISEDPSVTFSVNINSTDISCNGLTDGSATATVSGGTPPYIYAWSPGGANTPSINGLSPNGYTLQVTDAQGCTITQTVNIQEPAPLSVTAAGTDPTCYNGADGQIQITASSGGTGTYEYSIGGAFQPAITFPGLNTAQSPYTVTIRDVNSCTATTTVSLQNPPQIQINSVTIPESCANANNGSITPNPSGGTGPYQCALGFPVNYAPCGAFTSLSAGNYVISVKDADGCEATESININLIPALTISLVSKRNVSCNGESDGMLQVNTTGGTAPVKFSINGGVNFRSSPVFDSLSANNYTVYVEDANGCSNTLNVEIAEPSVLIPSVLFQIPVSCNGLSDASIVITASGGTGPYLYSMDSSNFFQSGFFNALGGGNFDFYVVDNNDCPATLNASTIEPDSLLVNVVSSSPASCAGIDNGSLTLIGIGGTPPYKYSLNNGPLQNNTVFSSLSPGHYLIGIEDHNGCVAVDSAFVDANDSITSTVTVTSVSCYGDNTGTIEITGADGTSPYEYSINTIPFQSSGIFNGLAAGTYTTTAKDASGCTAMKVVDIAEPPLLTASIDSVTDASCPDIADGSIYVTTQGGFGAYSYEWSNGALTEDLPAINGGTYILTITDDNGCTFELTAIVDQPNAIFTDITNVQDVSCAGFSDGFVDVDIAGGVPPFDYAWSNGSNNQDLIGVPAGNYALVVTDAGGCTVTDAVTINTPPAINSTIDITLPSCATSPDASIDLEVTGGVPPYDYFWSNFVFTQDQTGIPAGTYTVLITDSRDCEHVNDTVIPQATPLTATLDVIDVSCFGNADGTIKVNPTGGVGPYTYTWSNAANGDSIFNLGAGTYDVTVTDASSCTGEFSAVVDEPDELRAQVFANDVDCFGKNTGSADIFVVGGTGLPAFTWTSNGSVISTQPVLRNVAAGIYLLEVRDENNCIENDTAVINEPADLTLAIASTDSITCITEENGSVTLTTTGGIPPFEFFVTSTGFQNDSVFTGLAAGTYGAEVLDDRGCRATTSFTILEPEALEVDLDPVLFLTVGAMKEIIPNKIISADSIISYQWSPPDNLSCDTCAVTTVTGSHDQTYTLVVTDINGCTASDQITVTIRDFAIYIPNIFTPNGDELNDEFKPEDFGSTATIEIKVFNRWGGKVFEDYSVEPGWDGTFKGKPMDPGVFVYKVNGVFRNGEPFNQTGTVTLIR